MVALRRHHGHMWMLHGVNITTIVGIILILISSLALSLASSVLMGLIIITVIAVVSSIP